MTARLAAFWVCLAGVAHAQTPPGAERVTFDEAIRRALANNPGVAEAAQAILRAEALLQQVNTVYRPTISGSVTTTILDSERGFNEFVTQPQTQSLLGASVSFPVLAPARWAERAQTQDQIRVARLGVGETRRQVAWRLRRPTWP
jgi:outer membrane protein TolC